MVHKNVAVYRYTCNQWRRQRSIIKESGYFEVRKSLSQVTRSQGRSQDFHCGALFSSKKVDDLF